MNLIMMGTGDFAVPTFRHLLDHDFRVLSLVTQPDRPKGRKHKTAPAPIKELASERQISVFQPEDINTPESLDVIRDMKPDLLIVAAYGQILSDDLLMLPTYGGINLHSSLLPKYRGAAPINWAIYKGDQTTGVTVIQMSCGVDAGTILLQSDTPIHPEETAGELEARLADLGAPLVAEAIRGLESGSLIGTPQDPSLVTKAPKLRKENGAIDWTQSAEQVCLQIRAMQPWPMPYTHWTRPESNQPVRLIVERARVGEVCGAPFPPGTVVAVSKEKLLVAADAGSTVSLMIVRPAGKRGMAISEFLRGNPVAIGDCLTKSPQTDR